MSFLLNSCLDIFDIRQNNNTIDQDLGLLQAVDERLATYGWLTNTGVKFVIVVDMAGRPYNPEEDRKKNPLVTGLRDSDLKPVSTSTIGTLIYNAEYMKGVSGSTISLHPAPSESVLHTRWIRHSGQYDACRSNRNHEQEVRQ